MARKLIAGMTASLIILTGMAAAPAKAQSQDEIGKLIAGAITLFIVGNAVANASKPKAKAKVEAKPETKSVKPKVTSRGYQTTEAWRAPDDRRQARGRWGEHPHKVLPAACYFVMDRGHEDYGVYGDRCLAENLKKYDWLPLACQRDIRVRYGRQARVHDARCLEEFGYRTEARHGRHSAYNY